VGLRRGPRVTGRVDLHLKRASLRGDAFEDAVVWLDAREPYDLAIDVLCPARRKDDLDATLPSTDDAEDAARGAQLLGVDKRGVLGHDA